MQTGLCPWRHIFGIPRQGVHSWRIVGDTAGIDYFGTIGLSIMITYLTNIPLELITICAFVCSIILHYFFCVPTNLNKWLFGNTI